MNWKFFRLLVTGFLFCLFAVFGTVSTTLADDGFLVLDVAQPAWAGERYWTAERMARARPRDASIGGAPVHSSTVSPDSDAQPLAAPGGRSGAVSTLAPWKIDDDSGFPGVEEIAVGSVQARYPFLQTTHHVLRSDHNPGLYPYSALGKIFFTLGGMDYVCSGSAVGNRAVLTAGHCVSDGSGRLAVNIVFVPVYRGWLEGEARYPAGRWTPAQVLVFEAWHNRRYWPRDVAALVTRPRDGRTLQQVVGALGFAVNQRREAQHYTAFGYPSQPPWNGKRLTQTSAPWSVNDTRQGTPATIGIGTLQRPGSSGGPWLVRFWPNGGGQRNLVNGIFSHYYSSQPNAMYSPYFDSAVGHMLNFARSQ